MDMHLVFIKPINFQISTHSYKQLTTNVIVGTLLLIVNLKTSKKLQAMVIGGQEGSQLVIVHVRR